MPLPSAPSVSLLMVGVDHRCADLDLRERVAYDQAAAEEILVHLLAKDEIEEALLLSTCNRTEIYLRVEDDDSAFHLAMEQVFVRRAPQIQEEGRFYVKRRLEAARHLLEVASGLQSMVIGEPEILGQVKQAVSLSEAVGSSGVVLRGLARSSISAGGRARSETSIGDGPVSFGYSVVELANNIFDGLEECSVLVLGAGETSMAVSRSLLERGAHDLQVANRSHDRAQRFCKEFPGARIVPFEERLQALEKCDLVVAATSAPEAILTREALSEAMRRRRNRPLLIVDLGVPRDVDPAARDLRNLFLHDIDSLQGLIERTLERRREEIPRVSRIIDEELERFEVWLGGLAAAPLVAQLHRRAERIRQQELESHLSRFPSDTHSDLDLLTRSIVRKLLHHPSTRLRDSSDAENLEQLAAIRELFQLDDDET